MTRSEAEGSGTGANQNDQATWLDLVARLESMPTALPESKQEPETQSRQEPLPEAKPERSVKDLVTPAYGPRDYIAEEEPEEFVPEEPPSLAGAAPQSVLAWLGAVGAPLALVLCVIFFRNVPAVGVWALIAIFVASVVFLMWRLPQEKDDHDDGARL
ncbi:hypothetical protein ACQR35_12570 [Pseudarthrobacter sp. J1738]|uniref:hypothetical protein n=1 Tax=unclassified Pseudarthrobacter TaxID=2647000 RepID=UPI003D2AFFF4